MQHRKILAIALALKPAGTCRGQADKEWRRQLDGARSSGVVAQQQGARLPSPQHAPGLDGLLASVITLTNTHPAHMEYPQTHASFCSSHKAAVALGDGGGEDGANISVQGAAVVLN